MSSKRNRMKWQNITEYTRKLISLTYFSYEISQDQVASELYSWLKSTTGVVSCARLRQTFPNLQNILII